MSVKTILYVENDLVSQTMYQKRLEREGYHVECARDGQVALDILSERIPDLVLLDLMLPKVSGADVLNYMHADPRLTTIPVIIFSNAPMTEVPPDSLLAQGTRRLLKSDCTFPTLLETIQDTLAHPPEMMVVEADNAGQRAAIAANNGHSHQNGVGTIMAPPPVEKSTKQVTEFLKEAAAMLPKIREHSMGYIKAPGSEASQTHLSGLHQRVHLLNSSVAQAGCPRVSLLTNAFDALLSGIMDKPTLATPSVLQTIAQAVDCLDGLLKNADGYSVGPTVQAKVLVVDDDTVCNHVNVTSLKRANFEAVGVKDPAAALSLLETTAFELVVLDVNMPGMTGFDVCEKMRRLPHCKKTPVIFVTAFSNFDNRKQSVLSGGNDFVAKPVSPLELALKVTVNLIKARVQSGSTPQLEPKSAANNGSAKAPAMSAPSRINQPVQAEPAEPEPKNRLAANAELGTKPAGSHSRKIKPQSEESPAKSAEDAPQTKALNPDENSNNGKTEENDIEKRLRESTAALERATAGLDKEASERTRIEAQWRDQLNAAKALVGQSQAVIKEKEARCGQLEKELAKAQQEQNELQKKFAAEQQAAAKAQQEIKANQEKHAAERTKLESEWREQLNAAKQSASQTEAVLKEKETRCGQLEKELSGLKQTREELQTKFAAEQQAAAKAQQEIKETHERLRQTATELERAKTALEQQLVEQKRQQSDWQAQLNAAQAATGKLEAALKENENRCGELTNEVTRLQQVRDDMQSKFTAQQQATAKAQEEAKELKSSIEAMSAERANWESQWRQQLGAAKELTDRMDSALKENEDRLSQLGNEFSQMVPLWMEFQNKMTTGQQAVAKSQHDIQKLKASLEKHSK